jgi:hypothetical protein
MRDVIADTLKRRPANKVYAFRLPEDLILMLSCHAALTKISRNKLIENILQEYCEGLDGELRGKLTAMQQRDTQTLDLFA